jgi:hypothetical protein
MTLIKICDAIEAHEAAEGCMLDDKGVSLAQKLWDDAGFIRMVCNYLAETDQCLRDIRAENVDVNGPEVAELLERNAELWKGMGTA